jgi:uncharacterized protein YjiK
LVCLAAKVVFADYTRKTSKINQTGQGSQTFLFLPKNAMNPINPSWLLISIILLLVLNACQPAKKATNETLTLVNEPIPYNLTEPAERIDLPDDLREVSGLSYYKPGRLAMIQDELAVVFIYDLAKKRVVDEHVFGRRGDYEGVEFVNGELYALRSDGELYHFRPTDGVKTLGAGNPTRHIRINLPSKNGSHKPDIEGLGYDPKLNALLLATKDAANGGTDKIIYLYDLKNEVLWRGPVLSQAILQIFANRDDDDELKPSGIAVHPKTGEYYVLASAGHSLVVTNRNGKILSVAALDKTLFRQPEGICFAPDGTLFIASEGGDSSGYLLRFVMTK